MHPFFNRVKRYICLEKIIKKDIKMEEVHKICTKCNLNKSLSEYANCKRGKYNKQPKCKKCNKSYRETNRDKLMTYLNNYYRENKEEITVKNKKYVQDNYENIQEYKKKWHLDNKVEIAEKKKKWYLTNKEVIQQYKKEYYQNNKGRVIEKTGIWKKQKRKFDKLFELKLNISNTIRRSIQRRFKKSKVTKQILSCTIDEFKQHIESQFENWMSWQNYGNVCETLEPNCSWDLDHIIPISYANTEEEVYTLNHWSNFQPLCSFKNRNIKRDNIYPLTNLELKITI
jgi:hypothetical protein